MVHAQVNSATIRAHVTELCMLQGLSVLSMLQSWAQGLSGCYSVPTAADHSICTGTVPENNYTLATGR